MPFVEQVMQSGFLFGSCPAHDIHGSEDSCRSKTPKKQEHGHPDHHRRPEIGPILCRRLKGQVTAFVVAFVPIW